MSIILIVFLALLGMVFLLLLTAFFMKKEYTVRREILIDVPVQKAYDFLKLLRNQERFNKWAKADPNREWDYKGTDGTPGYIISWKGNKDAGEGAKEIMNLVEGKLIETEIRFVKPMKMNAGVNMETEFITENQCRVSIINSGKMSVPMNLFIPIAEKRFPKDMDESLVVLKNVLEKE